MFLLGKFQSLQSPLNPNSLQGHQDRSAQEAVNGPCAQFRKQHYQPSYSLLVFQEAFCLDSSDSQHVGPRCVLSGDWGVAALFLGAPLMKHLESSSFIHSLKGLLATNPRVLGIQSGFQ